jgi:hypothetical protein
MDHVPFEPTDRSSRLRADIRIGLDELDAGAGRGIGHRGTDSPSSRRARASQMTEILFYHLQRQLIERVLPMLLEKSLARDRADHYEK